MPGALGQVVPRQVPFSSPGNAPVQHCDLLLLQASSPLLHRDYVTTL